MKKQFEDVSSKYGAPMGRASFCSPEGNIRVFLMRMVDLDYDDGGAYWGGGPDVEPLWCARNDEGTYCDFARAKSYAEALAALDLSPKEDSLICHNDDIVLAYLQCALWSSQMDLENYELEDFDDKAWTRAEEDCGDFLASIGGELPEGWSADQFGYDFWLTRNGHGVGFWDRGRGVLGETLSAAAKIYGSCDVYEQDGKLYLE